MDFRLYLTSVDKKQSKKVQEILKFLEINLEERKINCSSTSYSITSFGFSEAERY